MPFGLWTRSARTGSRVRIVSCNLACSLINLWKRREGREGERRGGEMGTSRYSTMIRFFSVMKS